MCGIAGAINYKEFDPEKAKQTLLHRGPDEQTVFYYENVTLVHTRLAVLDISGGHQPMHYGPYTIIFNGEIYNHMELRDRLDDVFMTRSDTETLVHLYAKYSDKCLDMIDGMFAFAILDKKSNEIFFARDRTGKKPLYIYHQNNRLLFASELNVIKSILPLEIKKENICHYLRLGSFYKSSTPYENVFELQAGSYMRIDLNNIEINPQKWWDIFDFYSKPLNISFDNALEQVDSLLNLGVKRRLESSDLEVGTFLSGGIDSTLVTAIASSHKDKLRTFTVSFDGTYDESTLARLVANKYNTDHKEIRISFDNLQNDLEKILCNYGEPFADSSAVPSYYVSKEAKKHLTVILNGDGADELFGGYRRYVPFAVSDFFTFNPALKQLANCFKWYLPMPNEKKNLFNYLYRLIDLAGKKGCECYLSATIDSFEGFEKNIISVEDYLKNIRIDFDYINHSDSSGLQKIMIMDFDTILAGNLLVKMDIATMAHSLEGRSPFLNKELLEFVPRLPDKYKVKGKTTKFILRELAKKYLPKELINQPKRGFEIPLKKWIEGDLKERVFDNLGGECYSQNFVKKSFLSDLLNNKIRISDEKRAKILWTLLSLEIWYKHNK